MQYSAKAQKEMLESPSIITLLPLLKSSSISEESIRQTFKKGKLIELKILAENPIISKEWQKRLLNFQQTSINTGLSKNPALAAEIQEALTQSTSLVILRELTYNPNSTLQTLVLLSKKEIAIKDYVMVRLLSEENTSAALENFPADFIIEADKRYGNIFNQFLEKSLRELTGDEISLFNLLAKHYQGSTSKLIKHIKHIKI